MSRTSFLTPDGVPEVVAAAGLALAVMQVAGCASWSDVVSRARDIADSIELSERQVDVLNRYAGALALLRTRPGSIATIAGCPKCGRYQVATSVVKKCPLTANCEGVMVRAKPAARK